MSLKRNTDGALIRNALTGALCSTCCAAQIAFLTYGVYGAVVFPVIDLYWDGRYWPEYAPGGPGTEWRLNDLGIVSVPGETPYRLGLFELPIYVYAKKFSAIDSVLGDWGLDGLMTGTVTVKQGWIRLNADGSYSEVEGP